MKGDLEGAAWLMANFSPPASSLPKDLLSAAVWLPVAQHLPPPASSLPKDLLSTAVWLPAAQHLPPPASSLLKDPLSAAVWLPVAQHPEAYFWLRGAMGESPERWRHLFGLFFAVACSEARLGLLQELIAAHRDLVDNVSTFWGVCADNDLVVARYLAKELGLTGVNFRPFAAFACRKARDKGHLALAQWLVEHFELTPADSRGDNGGALSEAHLGYHPQAEMHHFDS